MPAYAWCEGRRVSTYGRVGAATFGSTGIAAASAISGAGWRCDGKGAAADCLTGGWAAATGGRLRSASRKAIACGERRSADGAARPGMGWADFLPKVGFAPGAPRALSLLPKVVMPGSPCLGAT